MIRSFRDRATEDVFNGADTKAARQALPPPVHRRGRAKLALLHAAGTLEDLAVPPGNRLEALRGDRAGQHSIRINNQYRLCFRWTPSGPEDVEITDYH